MASAKDTRRTSVIADLQDTLELQKQQLEQLRQSQKQPVQEQEEDEDEDSDEDDDEKARKKTVSEATIQQLTEENRRLTEECETAQLRIATLMEVSCRRDVPICVG